MRRAEISFGNGGDEREKKLIACERDEQKRLVGAFAAVRRALSRTLILSPAAAVAVLIVARRVHWVGWVISQSAALIASKIAPVRKSDDFHTSVFSVTFMRMGFKNLESNLK